MLVSRPCVWWGLACLLWPIKVTGSRVETLLTPAIPWLAPGCTLPFSAALEKARQLELPIQSTKQPFKTSVPSARVVQHEQPGHCSLVFRSKPVVFELQDCMRYRCYLAKEAEAGRTLCTGIACHLSGGSSAAFQDAVQHSILDLDFRNKTNPESPFQYLQQQCVKPCLKLSLKYWIWVTKQSEEVIALNKLSCGPKIASYLNSLVK